MQEILLFGGQPQQDPTKTVKLLSANLLYLTPDNDPVKVLSTKMLYLTVDRDPVTVLSAKLLYLVPEV